jgi:hypothetical protein
MTQGGASAVYQRAASGQLRGVGRLRQQGLPHRTVSMVQRAPCSTRTTCIASLVLVKTLAVLMAWRHGMPYTCGHATRRTPL